MLQLGYFKQQEKRKEGGMAKLSETELREMIKGGKRVLLS